MLDPYHSYCCYWCLNIWNEIFLTYLNSLVMVFVGMLELWKSQVIKHQGALIPCKINSGWMTVDPILGFILLAFLCGSFLLGEGLLVVGFKVSAKSSTTQLSRIRLDTYHDETDTRYGIMHELGWESVRLDWLVWVFELTWLTRLGYREFSKFS